MSAEAQAPPSITFYILSQVDEDNAGLGQVQARRTRSEDRAWIKLLSIESRWIATLPCYPHLTAVQYALSCITGAKGSLWTSSSRPEESQQLVESEMHAPLPVHDYFYHYSSSLDSPSFIPSMVFDERVLTSTDARSSNFCRMVHARDGGRCVVTGSDTPGRRAHLLAHSLGNSTMRLLSESRSPMSNDLVAERDDARNGILLHAGLHTALAHKQFAFLPIPSFCVQKPEHFDSLVTVSSYAGDSPDFGAMPPAAITPAVVVLTEPNLQAHLLFRALEQGHLCRIYPGRTASDIKKRDPLQMARDEDARYPEIWILDVLLADCFLHHFATKEGQSWLDLQSKPLEGKIIAAKEAESRARNKRRLSTGMHGPKKAQKVTTTLNGEPWDSEAWGPPGFSIYRALACMPTSEAVAARKAEAEEEERRVAEQVERSKQATIAWIAEQRREASQNEAF